MLVTLVSQERYLMASSARTSAVQKNLIPWDGGLPSGMRRRAAMSAAIACDGQFRSHATCSTVSRAGNWPLKGAQTGGQPGL